MRTGTGNECLDAFMEFRLIRLNPEIIRIITFCMCTLFLVSPDYLPAQTFGLRLSGGYGQSLQDYGYGSEIPTGGISPYIGSVEPLAWRGEFLWGVGKRGLEIGLGTSRLNVQGSLDETFSTGTKKHSKVAFSTVPLYLDLYLTTILGFDNRLRLFIGFGAGLAPGGDWKSKTVTTNGSFRSDYENSQILENGLVIHGASGLEWLIIPGLAAFVGVDYLGANLAPINITTKGRSQWGSSGTIYNNESTYLYVNEVKETAAVYASGGSLDAGGNGILTFESDNGVRYDRSSVRYENNVIVEDSTKTIYRRNRSYQPHVEVAQLSYLVGLTYRYWRRSGLYFNCATSTD